MHSLYYFDSTLSDNLISFLASVPPTLHTQPECRCPPSHPSPLESECEDPIGTSRIPRLNTDAHDPAFLNDGDVTTWWESANGEAPVNLTISLGGLRASVYVGILFRSLLPQSMVLYYSTNGIDFTPRQYYSSDCSRFRLPNNGLLRSSTAVNCITTYSVPASNQLVEFRLLDGANRPGASDYLLTPELQDFAEATHIRLVLINWNSASRLEQYFAINEVLAYGQECVCNGHSNVCSGSDCVCMHNTAGDQCNQCSPLYNNKPWAEGTLSSANECEMCSCNGHSSSCVYNSTLDTGICEDCNDNTQGPQCESCVDFYYHPPGISLSDPSSCSPCNCNPEGITNNGDCRRADNMDGTDSGQCGCKPLTIGRRCDQCLSGFYNISRDNLDGCDPCLCETRGTVGGSGSCDLQTGQCECKSNVVGLHCSSCAENHFGLDNEEGCLQCNDECVGCTGPSATECLVSSSFY